MNAQPDIQIPMIFRENKTLERKVMAWTNVSEKQQNSELLRVCNFLNQHPLSSSREISKGIKLERTSVCRVLATKKNQKYFDTEQDKICKLTMQTVTAYQLTKEGKDLCEAQTTS